LDEELKVCNTLLSSESNEKEKEFDAKNKVLEEYKMIDEEQNMLFKGKVARIASSQADCILLTQLIFSGRLKDMNDEEILALLSVLMVDLKASKGHEMLGSKISDGFWNACLYLQ
jgi:superfamily II RNA helicase